MNIRSFALFIWAQIMESETVAAITICGIVKCVSAEHDQLERQEGRKVATNRIEKISKKVARNERKSIALKYVLSSLL